MNTCDPQGSLLPHFLGVVGELERQFISTRTIGALAAAKARGQRLGKQSTLPADVRARIVAARDSGVTYQAIADELNAEGVATGQGGAFWRAPAVRAAYLAAAPKAPEAGRLP